MTQPVETYEVKSLNRLSLAKKVSTLSFKAQLVESFRSQQVKTFRSQQVETFRS
jgi:hypothetical protein